MPVRRRAPGLITIRPTNRAMTGARNESLVPAARPAASPATATAVITGRFVTALLAAPLPARAHGVDQHRDRAEDQRHPDDVVQRLARLELDQVLRPERDRTADQAQGADAVRSADRVGGGEAEGEPAEVDQRREDVAVEGQQRHRVDDLGVRRVIRGEEDRVEVVDRAEVGAVRRTGSPSGMWYQSVSARSMPPARLPRVGTIQAAATTAQAPAASQIASRDASGAGGAGRGRHGRCSGGSPSATTAPSTSPAAIIVQASKAAKVPSSSATQDQRRDRDHRLGDPGRGARPAGQQGRPRVPGREGESEQDQRQLEPSRAGRRRRRGCVRRRARS